MNEAVLNLYDKSIMKQTLLDLIKEHGMFAVTTMLQHVTEYSDRYPELHNQGSIFEMNCQLVSDDLGSLLDEMEEEPKRN